MSAPVIAARRVLHPGRSPADRVLGAVVPRPRRALVWLPEGRTLYEALVGAFGQFGVRAGVLQLFGGALAAAVYHTANPDPDSKRAVEYGPPIQLDGGTRLVRATGSYGEDLAGRPLVHLHGVLAEADGRPHGGHLAPDRCVVGPSGVRALLLLSVGFKQAVDPETRFSIFFPFAEGGSHGSVDRAGDPYGSRRQRPSWT